MISEMIETQVMPNAMSADLPDWEQIRLDFPILDQKVNGHPLIYFDNAATSQKPLAVIEALHHYYVADNSNVHRGIHELSNRSTIAFEAARDRVAKFIGAKESSEIVFTRGTTESINLVAQTWGLSHVGKGDVILLTELEHHSNLVPWQMLAERTGARLRFVPVIGDGEALELDALESLLQGPVKLFAFTHISNSLGLVNPAKSMIAMAKKHGVTTLLDAAQSAGHLPLDVQDLECDFLAFSAHKICGPTGMGILYGRKSLLESMPPWQGGGEMISSVEYESSTWNTTPHKFEAGTPHIAGAIGMHTAIDYIDAIGRQRIFDHDQRLAEQAVAGLKNAVPGARIFGPSSGRGGVVSFELPGIHPHDLVTMADRRGVALRGGHHCTQPLMRKFGVPATVRASFYFYNTPEEVDAFVEIMRVLYEKFGG